MTPVEKPSPSSHRPSPPRKPSTSSASEMLTASELESLRREMRASAAYMQKAYPHLRAAKVI